MPDPEVMQGGTTEAVLLRYFESRIAGFEKSMLDLRTDIRDQGRLSNELLTKISDKLEQRIDTVERSVVEQQRVLDRHENAFTAAKWVTGAVATAVVGAISAAIASLFHVGINVPTQVNVPPLPLPGVIHH